MSPFLAEASFSKKNFFITFIKDFNQVGGFITGKQLHCNLFADVRLPLNRDFYIFSETKLNILPFYYQFLYRNF